MNKTSIRKLQTIPNYTSLVRLLLIPFILWIYLKSERNEIVFIILALSVVLGVLSEYTEYRKQSSSFFSVAIREFASKFTQLAIMCCLANTYSLIVTLIGLYLIKEILLLFIGYMAFSLFDMPYSYGWYDKVCSVVLDISISLFLLLNLSDRMADVLILVSCLIIIASFFLHLRFYLMRFQKDILRITENRKWMTILKILVVLAWVGIGVICYINKDVFSVDDIVSSTPQNVILAAVIILVLFAVKSISIFLYSGILYLVSGILLPPPLAISVNLLGTAVMVSIPYVIGKSGGAGIVEAVTKSNPKAARIKEIRAKNDFVFACFLRILGIFPSDILSLYMGAINCCYFKYLLSCYLGALPMIILFTIVGTNIKDPSSPAFIISLTLEIVLKMVAVLAGVIVVRKSFGKGHTKEKQSENIQ